MFNDSNLYPHRVRDTGRNGGRPSHDVRAFVPQPTWWRCEEALLDLAAALGMIRPDPIKLSRDGCLPPKRRRPTYDDHAVLRISRAIANRTTQYVEPSCL